MFTEISVINHKKLVNFFQNDKYFKQENRWFLNNLIFVIYLSKLIYYNKNTEEVVVQKFRIKTVCNIMESVYYSILQYRSNYPFIIEQNI